MEVKFVETMRIIQYLFTGMGVVCLGFTYYLMWKKDEEK